MPYFIKRKGEKREEKNYIFTNDLFFTKALELEMKRSTRKLWDVKILLLLGLYNTNNMLDHLLKYQKTLSFQFLFAIQCYVVKSTEYKIIKKTWLSCQYKWFHFSKCLKRHQLTFHEHDWLRLISNYIEENFL